MVHFKVNDKIAIDAIQEGLESLNVKSYFKHSNIKKIAVTYVALNEEGMENDIWIDKERQVLHIRIVPNFIWVLYHPKDILLHIMQALLLFSGVAIQCLISDFDKHAFEQDLKEAFFPTTQAA